MKVSSTLESNILSLPDETARLKGIFDGYYRYTVTYRVDPVRALRNNAITVNIHVSGKSPDRVNNRVFETLNPASIVSRLQTASVSTKEQIAASKQYILTYISDISARIPNDQTTNLSKASADNYTLRTVTKQTTVSVGSLDRQDITVPVLLKPSTSLKGGTDVKALSQQMLFQRNEDPASIGIRTNLITTEANSIAGTKPTLPTAMTKGAATEALISSVVTPTKNPPTSSADVAATGVVVVVEKETISYIDVTEDIDIPVSDLAAITDFYLIFELVDNKSVVVSKETAVVAHSKNLVLMLKPSIPPEIRTMVGGGPGRVTLYVQQKDPNAKGVKLYRRIVPKSDSITSALYTYIGRLELTKADGEKSLTDRVLSTNPVIYRVIPYDENEVLSAEFSSTIVKSIYVPYVQRTALPAVSFVSLSYDISSKGIAVNVKNVPQDIVSVQLYRQDLSIKQPKRVAIAQPVSLGSSGNAPVVVLDGGVKSNRIYRYTCQLIHKTGHVIESNNSLTVEYIPITNNIITTTIVNPVVVQSDTGLDIQFTLRTDFVKRAEEQVRSTLDKQGVLQYFSTAIDNSKLQDLVAYQISRINLTTGQEEDFGVVDSEVFSDTKYGSAKGVKPVTAGNEYQYIVKSRLRKPETTLPNYTKTVSYTNTPSKDYTYEPARWLHPITLSEGNLVTERTLQANYAQTAFTFGDIGYIATTNVSLLGIQPSVSLAQAIKLNSSNIMVRWRVQGTLAQIDHFLIVLDILGLRTIVGKCHNTSDSGLFEFIDVLDNGEQGGLTYMIIPVLYDYSRGNPTTTNTVYI